MDAAVGAESVDRHAVDHGHPDVALAEQVGQGVEALQREPRPPAQVGGSGVDGGDDTALKVYLYSRSQSVMGGTSQIQRNLIATRLLGLPR